MKRIDISEAKYYRKLNPETDFRTNMRQAIAFCLIPDGNSEIVEYYGESIVDPTQTVYKPHYVYVLVNPGLPGICKIGFTRTSVYERVKQINASTGVITPYYPVFAYKCPNGRLLENDIHNHLESLGMRVNDKREGFHISSGDAIKIIEQFGKKYQQS